MHGCAWRLTGSIETLTATSGVYVKKKKHQPLENPNKSGARSVAVLCTLNTGERERERADPFKGGGVSSFTPPAERTGGWRGREKIKAAARSVESWLLFSNIQMTAGGTGGTEEVVGIGREGCLWRGEMPSAQCFGQPQSCPLAALGPPGASIQESLPASLLNVCAAR